MWDDWDWSDRDDLDDDWDDEREDLYDSGWTPSFRDDFDDCDHCSCWPDYRCCECGAPGDYDE